VFPVVKNPQIDISNQNFNLNNKTKKSQINLLPNLEAKITKVSVNGEATIKFSKLVNLTSNLNLYTISKAFTLVVEPRTGNKPPYNVNRWNVTDITPDGLVIQIIFDNPSEISISTVSGFVTNIIGL
jgi:hypothetical protein